MVLWAALLASAVTSAEVEMDSLLDEVTAGSTHQPISNTHSFFFSNHLAATLGIGEHWLLGTSYTFSLVQGVGFAHTPELDATLVLDEHWALMLSADGSPPTVSNFPICVATARGRVCAAVAEQLWSVGGNALATYDSGGRSNFEWGVDGNYSPHLFELRYTARSGARTGQGVTSDLWQHRLGLGATGHMFHVFDLDLRGAYYFYSGQSQDIFERALLQLAGGPPVAPRVWEAAANLTAFFLGRRLSAKVSALFAPYADVCLGTSGQLSLKISGSPGPVRVWGSILFQSDKPPTGGTLAALCSQRLGGAVNPSLSSYASVGAEYNF